MMGTMMVVVCHVSSCNLASARIMSHFNWFLSLPVATAMSTAATSASFDMGRYKRIGIEMMYWIYCNDIWIL